MRGGIRLFRDPASPFWFADFRCSGKRRRESTGCTREADAHRWTERRRNELALDAGRAEERQRLGLIGATGERVTLADFVERDYLPWMRQTLKSADKEAFTVGKLVRAFGKLHLDEIDAACILRHVQERAKQRKPATVNREVARLRRVLKHARTLGLLPRLPLDEWPHLTERNRRLLALTPADYLRLVTIAYEPVRSAVIVAANTGMRRGELVNLTWADVDLGAAVARVRDPKNGCPREVPLNRPALEALAGLPRGIEDPHVFLGTRGGRPWAFDAKRWHDTLARAGLGEIRPRVRFHDLRACFCSWMLEAGIGWHITSSISGHKGGSSAFDRYVTIGWTAKRAAVEKLAAYVEAAPEKGRLGAESPATVPDPAPLRRAE
ncbi:MAG: site-specific integrase [Planctomycetes bacterium]|nr:site-specific integrase [Planctomycetota bacterium]